MAAWPNTLPQHVRRSTFRESPIMPKVRFDPDSGPPIERPKSTVDASRLDCSMFMTLAQRDIFRAFVRDDCARATANFDFPHPYGGTVTARFDADPPYQIAPLSNVEVEVSFTLRVIG